MHTLSFRQISNFILTASALGLFLHLVRQHASTLQMHQPLGHPDQPAKYLEFSVYLWAIRLTLSSPLISVNSGTVLLIAFNAAWQRMEDFPKNALILSSLSFLHFSSRMPKHLFVEAHTHSSSSTRSK